MPVAAGSVRAVNDAAVLSRRALNRALLSRQLLLRRADLPGRPDDRRAAVIRAVEHLVGLQAQAPFPPYYGLWSRLGGFRPGDLAELLTGRGVVRIALMRGTIHLVSARDCLPLRALVQPVLERGFRGNFGRQLTGVDAAALALAGRELVDATPMTFSQLGEALAERWPDQPPAALAQAVRAHVPLVQVPPRAVWGRAGQSLHTSAEHWLGLPAADPGPDPGPDPLTLAGLVRRYLAAFGPASVRDVAAWSGLTALRPVLAELRPSLVTFRDEQGTELFDLPSAPRPGEDEPAPVRLTAEFDNLLLAHADRTRVVHPEHLRRFHTINGIIPGAVLVGGFVAGRWRLARVKGGAMVTIELFTPAGDRDEIAAEARRMLAFCAEGSSHEIRFAAIG
jgi:hypothetical protein